MAAPVRLLLRNTVRSNLFFNPFVCAVTSCARNYRKPYLLRRWDILTHSIRLSSNNLQEPPIPEWEKPPNEPLELTKARLVYQSRKRGMSENGLLLSNFASRYLDTFTEEQLHQYDLLINKPNNDWDIFNWATGNKPTPPEYDNEMMKLLKEFVSNPDMESRIRQPDLPPK